MGNVQTVSADVGAPPRRRPYFLLGVLLVIVGVAGYVVQLRMKQLVVPWYAPALATIGVLLMVLSVRQRPGVLRIAGLVLFVLLAGFEWFFVLAASKTPAYTGPAQPGHKVPAFTAALADGRAFTEKDLENGFPTVMLFFRGRW